MDFTSPLPSDHAAAVPAPERQLELLYRQQFGKVTAYFRRCGATDGEARELAQDSFLRAYRALADFRGEAQFATWFWTIARHVWIDHLRRADPPADAVDLDALPGPCHLSQHLRGQCLQRGFARFAAEYPERAQALYLAAVEEMPRKELAELLGRSEHATHEYLSQCRAKLRPYIVDCDGLEP